MAAGTEEDTELRDLLVQTLESSGVLNKIKAELRAAVFLALEEQEKVENKTPLVNESLKKFLNTKDGRLVAGLVTEFLQFFNLDFTLAVFQPESSTLNGLEARESLAQHLGIIEAEGTVDGPLLLEVVRRCQQKKGASNSGDVVPIISGIVHSPPKSSDGRLNLPPLPSKIPRYKGHRKKKQCLDTAEQVTENSQSDTTISSGETKSKGIIHFLPNEAKLVSQPNRDLDTKEKNSLAEEEDDAEDDPFFDDPIPKPEQTYGCDTVEDAKELPVTEGRQKSWERKNDSSKEGNIASLSGTPPINSGLNSLIGASPLKEPDSANSILKDIKMVNSKFGSLELGDEEEYADDFNSASQRSEKSEASIGEEIEDISVELDEFNTSDKLEDFTQDFTISQLSGVADYLEDVA
ncbi:PREDICTED: FGFR1 oncogene partner isoform X1 [Gekko japonicus]|uniref:Centrosomal protein 43 n=1 Tax=Gekko japonicus TaxID=146911 RepID=A0ABM1KVB8_GEKJA|nr:PREDICTED: FGFR1 oncogene partner isoform X1 [Gekko japonicus]